MFSRLFHNLCQATPQKNRCPFKYFRLCFSTLWIFQCSEWKGNFRTLPFPCWDSIKNKSYALTSFCSLLFTITYFNMRHLLHNMLIFHYSLWVLMLCEFTTTDGAESVLSLALIIHQASLLLVAQHRSLFLWGTIW